MDVWNSQILPSLQSPTCYSSLSQTYDNLLDALKMEDESASSNSNNDTADAPPKENAPTSFIVSIDKTQRQRIADYLRALHLTCQILIGILDHGSGVAVKTQDAAGSQNISFNTPQNSAVGKSKQSKTSFSSDDHPHHRKQRLLEQTKGRTELLLNVLWERGGDDGLPESEHEILQRNDKNGDDGISVLPLTGHAGLYTYTFCKEQGRAGSDSDDEDGGELLTFDRKALEAEEKILILMASTPIPEETAADDGARGTEMAAQEEPTADEGDNNLQIQLQAEWKEVYQECQERLAKRQRVS